MSEFRFQLTTPGGWYLLESADESSASQPEVWLAAMKLAPDVEDRIQSAVARASHSAIASSRVGSERWILIRNPSSGIVDAILSLDFHLRVDAADASEYALLADAAGLEDRDVRVVNRTVRQVSEEERELVLVHDFVLPSRRTENGDPISERAIAAVFPREGLVMAELSVVTQDLGLLDDALGYLSGLLESFKLIQTGEVTRA
jgi:hypothetical protein